MEHNQPKNEKLLTPLMLATALSMVAAPVMAYDHDKQLSVGSDSMQIGNMTVNFTRTGTGSKYAPYDNDTD